MHMQRVWCGLEPNVITLFIRSEKLMQSEGFAVCVKVSQVVKETISKLVSGALSQCEPTAVVCESIQDVLSKLLLVCLNTPISQTRKWIHLCFKLDTSWLHVRPWLQLDNTLSVEKYKDRFFIYFFSSCRDIRTQAFGGHNSQWVVGRSDGGMDIISQPSSHTTAAVPYATYLTPPGATVSIFYG